MKRRLLFILLLSISARGAAQDMRELCPTRPGLGTPPCIVDRRHVVGEVAIGDWIRENDPDAGTDTIVFGDLLLRYGIDSVSEVQLGWTAFGHVRERDKALAAVSKSNRVGDITLAYKRNLSNPDGEGLSIAFQPFATLPVGRSPIGAGDWGGGLLLAVSRDLGNGLQLQLTPEVDAAVDEDGNGRHLSFGAVIGVGVDLAETINAAIEFSAFRDNDPSGPQSELLAAFALAWQPHDNLQLDVGSVAGLNHASPDLRLYFGVSQRF
jgi:hypothetical protein